MRQFEEQFPPLLEIRQVYRALGSYFQLAYGSGAMTSFDFDLLDFAHRFNFSPTRVLSSLRILEESGWLSLSESVFQPATLWLTSGPQDLYQYQLKNQKIDHLIKTVQRLYQGLYQYPVAIQLTQIMQVSGYSEEQITRLLQFLHQSNVLEYRPMRDKPQLQFELARQDADQLQFDTRLLNFRKDRQRDRIQAIDDFLHATDCRQQAILAYFGEASSEPCRQCDRCLEQAGRQVDRPADEEVQVRLRQLFQTQEEWTMAEIQRQFSPQETVQLKRILQDWSDEGLIRESYGKLILDT